MALSWQNEQMTQSKALVRQKILESNDVKVALNRYLHSLNLQGQVNAGRINEQQAMQLFNQAIQNFHQHIVNTVNQQFKPANLPALNKQNNMPSSHKKIPSQTNRPHQRAVERIPMRTSSAKSVMA